MNSELLRYATGEATPSRDMRREAQKIRGQVVLGAVRAEGIVALGEFMFEEVVKLDARRRAQLNGDPVREAMLFEVEAGVVKELRRTLSNVYGR